MRNGATVQWWTCLGSVHERFVTDAALAGDNVVNSVSLFIASKQYSKTIGWLGAWYPDFASTTHPL
ncbi:hypothetical protein ELS19_10235 [Halogeometricum borinquense]|uniref:Uncharacterized protein n=1 Tax=Halogeometricum borinquense TaxID=60847 RepID=A0A482TQS2_9EURY|nr:hypothetical protein ELS19_10235 [Halogeometricum borinquense]